MPFNKRRSMINKVHLAPWRSSSHQDEISQASVFPQRNVANALVPPSTRQHRSEVETKRAILTSNNARWADSTDEDEEWDPDFVQWKDGTLTPVCKTRGSKFASWPLSRKISSGKGKLQGDGLDVNAADLDVAVVNKAVLDPATFISRALYDHSHLDSSLLHTHKSRSSNVNSTQEINKVISTAVATGSRVSSKVFGDKRHKRTISRATSFANLHKIVKSHTNSRAVSSPAILLGGRSSDIKSISNGSSSQTKYSDGIIIMHDQDGKVSFLEKIDKPVRPTDITRSEINTHNPAMLHHVPAWFDKNVKEILKCLSATSFVNKAQYDTLSKYRQYLSKIRARRLRGYIFAMHNFRKVAFVLRRERYPGMVDLRRIQCTRWHKESLARAKDFRLVKKGLLFLDEALGDGWNVVGSSTAK